jgi:hypothetical protein
VKGPGMSQFNTVRKDDNSPVRAGIRIVHSQDWTPERRQRAAATQEQLQEQAPRRERRIRVEESEDRATLKLSLAAAALSASLFWVSYAFLHWKHLL